LCVYIRACDVNILFGGFYSEVIGAAVNSTLSGNNITLNANNNINAAGVDIQADNSISGTAKDINIQNVAIIACLDINSFGLNVKLVYCI
jgi:hypothetical protein